MDNVNEIMEHLGFKDREIKIYIALIKEGLLTAFQISKETRIDRTTTYDVLERLIDKGVVSTLMKNKTKHFKALAPEELLQYFREKYSSLEKIIPELNAISKQTKEQIKCELFQGKDGLKTVLKDLINAKKDYHVIGIRKEYEDILSYFNEQGILKLNELKVKEIAIVEKSAKFKKLKQGIYRYLDGKLISPITTLIYGNNVIFFIWVEPYFAIRIDNKYFREVQEEYFTLIWNAAQK